MPTDGADFGRTRPCYGRSYTMARDGADDAAVAECAMRGVELDIRRNGGVPAFIALVDAVVIASTSTNGGQLLVTADAIRREFADSSLTRHFADAAARAGLDAISKGECLTREQASEALITRVGGSRCCDGMTGYVARKRTGNLSESQNIVNSIKSHLAHTAATPDLAARMLNCTPKGLPARPAKCAPVSHTIEGLNEEL